MTSPYFSIIIPVYNGELFLEPTLKSLKAQNFQDFEVILVDDGSTDSSVSIIEPFLADARFKLHQQQNQGVAHARNNGFSQAKGQYIGFLDADDCWFPEMLDEVARTIQRVSDPVCLIYSGVYCVDHKNHLTSIRKFITSHEQSSLNTILANNLMIPSSTLMHRDVFATLGGFPTNTYHEDRVFFVRACKRFPAFSTGERSVVYREYLSGRFRSILNDYDLSVKAELSVLDVLKPELNEEEWSRLERFQRRSIFNRFLRYNLLPYAKRYASELPEGALDHDLKGLISKLSLSLNINLLYFCQLLVYFITGVVFRPWWVFKSQPLREIKAF
ncbi:MAG: glycosyltransferase [Vampirovibrionales bacterium]|nr:glycosyltransferase [Vampirovibrionales bacterium]